jgi:nucleotide-binding universal stress UspA family protein
MDDMAFRKILCPVDFSLGSQQAMLLAVRLANESEAELVVAHVWYLPPLPYTVEPVFPPDTHQAMIDDADRGLAAAAAEASRLGAKRVTTRCLTGVPWDQIVALLRSDAAFRLVVMGTHGRTGLDRVLMGSVTEQVIRHAPCPVLAVPARGQVSAFRHVLSWKASWIVSSSRPLTCSRSGHGISRRRSRCRSRPGHRPELLARRSWRRWTMTARSISS